MTDDFSNDPWYDDLEDCCSTGGNCDCESWWDEEEEDEDVS